MRTPTVVCVLRSGGDYKPEHVAALHARVQKWWLAALRFVVLTDTPVNCPGVEERALPVQVATGWWSKLWMFHPRHDDLGDMLYFDLDTVIVGALDAIARVGQLTLLRDFYRPERAQSGMMYLPLGKRGVVWRQWSDQGMKRIMQAYRGDGEFLDSLWRNEALRWQDALPGHVVSYKVHVRQVKGQIPPEDARVVCFHGNPRPWKTVLWERV